MLGIMHNKDRRKRFMNVFLIFVDFFKRIYLNLKWKFFLIYLSRLNRDEFKIDEELPPTYPMG